MKLKTIVVILCLFVFSIYANNLIKDDKEHDVEIGIKYGIPLILDGVISIIYKQDYIIVDFYSLDKQPIVLNKQNITYIDVR